jgi:FkbM family methyltransferase
MPTTAETLSQGWKIHQAGKVREAEQIYQQALAAEPMNASAWCYLGIAFHDQERYDEAVAAYQRALKLKPHFPIALNNLGNSFRLMRRLPEAVTAFDQALAQQPDYLIAFKNKSTTLCWEGQVEAALKNYELAVQYGPDDADIHKHLGILRLLLGDFAGGWPEYEWRWKTGEISLPKLTRPWWDGSSLAGKTILLTPEQGLGDTIQFIRYAPWLKQRYGCQILFHSPKALRTLLSTCAGIDQWVEDPANLPPYDCFAPLLHVPSVLGHTSSDFPAEVPYLSAEEPRMEEWRKKLAEYRGVKVGIVWRGSPTHQADVMRSIPLVEFAPLGRLKGVHFFSLQKLPAAEDLNMLAGRLEVVDLGRALDEGTGAFVETAAVLKNLDLLITCDTAIAHVAGALGVPVWVALCNVPDWRWLTTGERSAWYPTMRLFRQQAPGDWASVVEQIAAALEQQFPTIQKKQPEDYRVFTSGFNRLTRTRQGLVLYNHFDRYIGRSLDRYGEFSAGEADLFRQAVRPGWTVVEAGANIGAHTLVLSKQVGPRGKVYAFEPQRVVFQTLCANLALNSITNVHARCEAVSNAIGTIMVPALDYGRENNFGGLPLGNTPARSASEGSAAGNRGEAVPVVTIDSLELAECQFLKVDVEGMELSVLQGAKRTIERLRPILYVENDRPDRSPPLIEHLLGLDYQLYWHLPPLYSADNFYRNAANEFGRTVSINMLGLHRSVATNITGLKKIDSPQSQWG